MKLCFASNNKHKIEEIRPLLGPDFSVLSLQDIGCFEDLAETQGTIEGNSLQKAQYVFDHYHIPCFADDTGLEVYALDMAPGVYSARYAGEQKNDSDNIALLLRNLEGKSDRRARFKAVITLIGLNGTNAFEGILEGAILDLKRGTRGFGYDPIFQPSGYHKTLAEMSLEEKNFISHRGIAVRKLVGFLRAFHKK